MASSSHQYLLLLLFLLVAVLPTFISCGTGRIVSKCERFIVNDQNVVTNQVKNTLSFLVTWTPIFGFAQANLTSVYGLAWCRGDISASFCSTCLNKAADKIQTDCPNYVVGARSLFSDFCYLRFDYLTDFRGELDTSFANLWYNIPSAKKIVKAHRVAFWHSKTSLLNGLKEATAQKQIKMFGKMDVYFDVEKSKIYGMAQCSQDLSTKNCKLCLDRAMRVLMINCMYRKSCEVMYGSCFLKYHTKKIKN